MRRARWFAPVLLVLLLAPATAAAQPDPKPPTSDAEAAPAEAGTPLTNVRQVVAGYYHSCALLNSGQVRCWGYNSDGELGNGHLANTTRAVVTKNAGGTGPLTNVIQLSAGIYHTCALLTNHQVRCWGEGDDGQLGHGHFTEAHRPVAVRSTSGAGNLTDVVELSSGGYHTCARLSNGQERCWGYNSDGQLGNDDTGNRARPVVVQNPSGTGPLRNVISMGNGYYSSCSTVASHQARCWGSNDYGELGNGDAGSDILRPQPVANEAGNGPLVDVTQVDVGYNNGCALLTTRGVRCWGYNSYGQLGDGNSPTNSYLPVVVRNVPDTGALTTVTELHVGDYSTCVRVANGQARCWGDGEYGAMGNGSSTQVNDLPKAVLTPSATTALTGITQLDIADYTACARLGNGTVRCWGYGEYGNIGNGLNNYNQLRTAIVTVA